jgi:outer membrane protein assembly factor BamB
MASAPASFLVASAAAILLMVLPVAAQQPLVVPTVADSPTAAELVRQAREQAETNPGESARVAAELLRDLADRLVQTDRPGIYRGVADEVSELLRDHPRVLERYCAEVGAQAKEWLAKERTLEVATRFAATDAGLEAMLRMAGRALQEARTDDALAWLRRAAAHPSAERDPAPRLAMVAMAAWAIGDAAGWSASRDALAAAPGVDPRLLALVRAMDAPSARPPRPTRSEASVDADAQVPPAPWTRAWAVRLPWSPASIRNPGIVLPEELPGRVESRTPRVLLHTMVPIIADGEVIVADGRTVACLDLHTHTMRWQAILTVDGGARTLDPMLTPCTVDAERVMTVVSQGELGGAVSSRVVAMRRTDGRVAWQRPLDAAEDGLPGGLRVAGAPAVAGDVLAVPCLRQSGRLELACWLVGLDAVDGAVRWAVPLGAANGLMQEFGTAVVVRGGMGAAAHDGSVIVGTAVGTAACVEASTGSVRWIARDDLSRVRAAPLQQCWEAVVPIIDGDSAWFLHADGRMVTRRSLEDGSSNATLALGTGEPMGAAVYLIGDADAVVGVDGSGGMSAVAPDDVPRRLWQRPQDPLDPPVGRAVLAREGDRRVILVPRSDRVELLELATGSSIGTLPVGRGGNIGVGDGRVAIASESDLEIWGQADRIVADLVAIVDRGGSPDADIALAECALAQGDAARALDMARRAMERIGTMTDADVASATGARIFDVLLSLVRAAQGGSDAVEALRSAAVLPGQRLRVALALSDRAVARDEWAEAARTLADAMPALDLDGLVDHAGARVRMGQVLSLEMQRLVVRAHAAGSDAVERAAGSVRPQAGDRAEAFARAWRGTSASIAALVDACDEAAQQGRDDDAARRVQRAMLFCLERAEAGLPTAPALLERLVVRFAGSSPGDLLTVTSLRRLQRAAGVDGALSGVAAASPWVLAPRLASVDGETPKGRRAIQFAATMPAIDPFAAQQGGPSEGLLVVNQQLVAVSGATLAPVWAIDMEDPLPGIVRLLPTTMVLERTMVLPGRLRGIDPSNGRVAWSIEDLGAVLGAVQPLPDRSDDEATLSRRGQFAVFPVGAGAVAVRGDGSCSRIEPDGTVRWVSPRSLPLVDAAQVTAGAVALVGMSSSADPTVTILSTASGQERGTVPLERLSSVDAVHSTLVGFVVSRGLSSAMIEDTEEGPRVLWERMGPAGATRRTAMAVLHEAMFLGQPAEGSRRVDLDDGSSTPLTWEPGGGGPWSPLAELDDGLLVATGDRVLLARADGTVVGSTRLSPSSTVQSAIACREGVIVQALETSGPSPIQGGSTFSLLDPRQGLRQVKDVTRVMVPMGWRRSMLLDGWLLQFGDDQCIAVPVGPS